MKPIESVTQARSLPIGTKIHWNNPDALDFKEGNGVIIGQGMNAQIQWNDGKVGYAPNMIEWWACVSYELPAKN